MQYPTFEIQSNHCNKTYTLTPEIRSTHLLGVIGVVTCSDHMIHIATWQSEAQGHQYVADLGRLSEQRPLQARSGRRPNGRRQLPAMKVKGGRDQVHNHISLFEEMRR